MALVSVALMGALGTGVQGRMLTSMARSLAAAADGLGETAVPADLASRARSPVLRVTTTALLGMATGVLWLMTNKPGWAGSVSVVVVLTAAGAAIGAITAGNRRSKDPAVYSSGNI